MPTTEKDLVCAFCGDDFKAKRADAVFCSSKCKTANWRILNG